MKAPVVFPTATLPAALPSNLSSPWIRPGFAGFGSTNESFTSTNSFNYEETMSQGSTHSKAFSSSLPLSVGSGSSMDFAESGTHTNEVLSDSPDRFLNIREHKYDIVPFEPPFNSMHNKLSNLQQQNNHLKHENSTLININYELKSKQILFETEGNHLDRIASRWKDASSEGTKDQFITNYIQSSMNHLHSFHHISNLLINATATEKSINHQTSEGSLQLQNKLQEKLEEVLAEKLKTELELKANISNLQEQVKLLTDNNKSIQYQLDEASAQISTKLTTAPSVAPAPDEANKHLNDRITKLLDQNQLLTDVNAQLQEQWNKISESSREQESIQTKLKSNIAKLEKKTEELTTENKELKDKHIVALKTPPSLIQELNQKIANLEKQNGSLVEENKDLKNQYEASLKTPPSLIQELNQKISNLDKQNGTLAEENKKLLQKSEQLQSSAATGIDNMKNQNKILSLQNAELQQKLTTLMNSSSQNTKRLTETDANDKVKDERLQSTNSDIHLMEQICNLKNEVSTLAFDKLQLEEKMKDYVDELAEKEKTIVELDTLVDNNRKDKLKLENNLNAMQQKLQESDSKLLTLLSEIKEKCIEIKVAEQTKSATLEQLNHSADELSRLKRISEDYASKTQKLKTEHERDLQKLKVEHEKDLHRLKVVHEEESQKQKSEFNEIMKKLELKSETEITKYKKDYKEESDQRKANYEQDLNRRNAEYDEGMKSQSEMYKQLIAEKTAEISVAHERVREIQSKLDDAQHVHANYVQNNARFQQDKQIMAGESPAHLAEIQTLKTENQFLQLKLSHQEKFVSQLQREVDILKEKYLQKCVEKREEKHKLREEYRRKHQEYQQRLQTEMEELIKENELKSTRLHEHMKRVHDQRDQQLDKLIEQIVEKMTNSAFNRKKYLETLSVLNFIHRNEDKLP